MLSINKHLMITLFTGIIILMSILHLALNTLNPTAHALQSTKNFTIQTFFLIDPDNNLQLADIYNATFISNLRQKTPWRFSTQSYWLKYALENNSPRAENFIMHLDNAMLDNLLVYQVDHDNHLIKQRSLGWKNQHLSLLNKSINNFKFEIAAFSRNDIYIQIQTQGITKTPINIYKPEYFQEYARSVHLIWGSFVGIILMMALYNLVIYYGLKKPIYLIYIFYLTSVLTLTSIVQGFVHYLFPPAFIALLRPNVISINFLTLAAALLFAIHFLNLKGINQQHFERCTKAVYVIISLSLLSLLLEENHSAPLFFITMFATYLLCFWLLFKSYKVNRHWSRLYIISWIPLLVGGAVQPLELTDIIPYSFLTRHLFPICIILEITLMGMALTERLRQQKERAIFNATHDLETRLPNYQALEKALAAKLSTQEKFTLCLIKVTGFKQLSPYLSPLQSRQVLGQLLLGISEHTKQHPHFVKLASRLFPEHKIARVKDNIFAVILSEHQNTQLIIAQLHPLHQLMKNIFKNSQNGIQIRTHIGFYRVNNLQQNAIDIIKKTSQASVVAVLEGRAINAFDNHQHLSLNIAKEFQQALQNNTLELYHQPQITLAENTVYGSEALLRWQHPSKGYIPAQALVDLAEHTGLINQLTLWVITRACQDIISLTAQGFHQHRVSVNISPSDIADSDFLENLKSILTRHPIPKHLLTLELTESVMIHNYQHLQQVMNGLLEMNINVSIDDYGTGYSSLTHLLQLPFNELKIDRLFIQDLEGNQRNIDIVKTTIDMAKVLKLRVVAEGVETQEEINILKDNNCEIVQGYFYARPQPFCDYLHWLQQRDAGAKPTPGQRLFLKAPSSV